MINQIQEDTGADITIDDDGTIYIGATTGAAAEAARETINQIANPTMPKVGERYLGTVVKITSFGAFISLVPGRDGLLHISEVKSWCLARSASTAWRTCSASARSARSRSRRSIPAASSR